MARLEEFKRELQITILEAGDNEVMHKAEFTDPDHKISSLVQWVKDGALWVVKGVTVLQEQRTPFPQCIEALDTSREVYKGMAAERDKSRILKNPNGCTHIGEMIHFSSTCLDDHFSAENIKRLVFEVISSAPPQAQVERVKYRGNDGGRETRENLLFIGGKDIAPLDGIKMEGLSPNVKEFWIEAHWFYAGAAYGAFHPFRPRTSELDSIDALEKRRQRCMELPELRDSCFAFNPQVQ